MIGFLSFQTAGNPRGSLQVGLQLKCVEIELVQRMENTQ
jgi:hypothetical protein